MDAKPVSTYQPVPIERILELKKQGLTTREIGKIVDRDHSTIVARLKPYPDIDVLDDFRSGRATIFDLMQYRFLTSVQPEDIQKMTVKDRVLSASILYDKMRLETDKSTANVNINHADIVEYNKIIAQARVDQAEFDKQCEIIEE